MDKKWFVFFLTLFFLISTSVAQEISDKAIAHPPLSAVPAGKKIPQSPDPLAHYRWDDPKATDGLEIYTLSPVSVVVDEPASATIHADSSLTITAPCNIRFDFGQVNAAWFEFDSPGFEGEVEMSISEFNEPAVFNAGSQHPKKTATPARHGQTFRLELNKELYEGVRFGWIHIRSLNKPMEIRSPRLVCQIKPTNYNGSFETNDTLLTRIWYTGAYTVKLNLLKDHFGAILMERSDRHSWTGDAHASQAASMVAFGNFDFVKENIRYTSEQYNGIASYSLYWILSLIDYYNYTGDNALMEEMLENACAKLNSAYEQYDTNAALSFYGWDERLGAGFETPNIPETYHAYHMLCIRSWTEFAASMRQMGKHEIAEKYQHYADEKIAALRAAQNWWQPFGLHASADAVNALFIKENEGRLIWQNAFADRMQRLSYSPFNQYFILQAMSHMQRHGEAITTVDDCWGGQIRYGGTTFFEVFRPSWNDISKPNDAPINNQCGYTSLTHPWSAGVTKWLTEEVLGVKPLSPGFETFVVKPFLSSRITRVKGDVPTPHGRISFAIDAETGSIRLSIPVGTTGNLAIPKAGRIIKSIRLNNGSNLRYDAEDDQFVYYYNLSPGNYKGRVSYTGKWEDGPKEKLQYAETKIEEDTSTRGDWKTKYGSRGHLFFNYHDAAVNDSITPPFVTGIELNKAFHTNWAVNVDDPRALKVNDKGNLGAIYTNDPHACMQTMTIDVKTAGEFSANLSLYFVDFDHKDRRSAIEVFDLHTKELLMPVYMVRDYAEGKYVTFPIDRAVRIRINQVRGVNAVCSALFFD